MGILAPPLEIEAVHALCIESGVLIRWTARGVQEWTFFLQLKLLACHGRHAFLRPSGDVWKVGCSPSLQ